MNEYAMRFVESHKDKLGGKVLEVGSFNVNGSVREIINVSVGIDMRKGRGVDLVCKAEDLLDHFPENHFDSVVSTDALEHIENWRGALLAVSKVVKPGGWWVWTMAHKNKGKHDYPSDYWRFDADQLKQVFPGCEVEELKVSIGWVWKNGDIDTSVEPHTV